MTPETTNLTGLPVIPAARKARCPLEPPAEFAEWREADGLQLALGFEPGPHRLIRET
jgi:hypothetical protein